MTAKEYLSQAFRLDQRINAKLEQIKSLHELATKATSTLSDSPRSASPNLQPIESIIAKVVDMEQEINQEIDSLVDLKRSMLALIARVSNEDYRVILELRYFCFKTWEQIALVAKYSLHHLYKMHGQALAECARVMEDDT